VTRYNRISRRRFLARGAALTSAGLTLPTLLPDGVLAAAERPGANDRIGVGFIGCGRRAGQLMRLPAQGRIVAAADCDLARAENVARRTDCKSFKSYRDYRELLDDKAVDAVVVATPDHWRALNCIHAAQAGKDIYAEKPLTLTIKEGRAIVRAARKYKRVFQTGSQQRSMGPNRVACEMIRNGLIGKVHTVITANYQSPWLMNLPGQPVPKGLDWNVWCGQAPPVPFHKELCVPRGNPGWISVWPYSGGEMTGWGAHGLDQIQWALGADESGPVEVWSEGGPYKPKTYTAPVSRPEGNKASASHKVFFRYACGTLVKLDNGSGAGGTFIGERGKIMIQRNSFKVDPPELAEQPLGAGAVRLYKSDNHMQNWFDCMNSRELCVADAEIGHRSCTVCHLGNIARWLGRKLRWDPEKELFPDDDEANKYLDTDKRKPYQLPEVV